MSNPIKYSTGSETLALKKGNFYIGTGDVDKGPTESTGYWNGISPPTSGYTIYLNKESQGPSIYIANNDTELINITNQISGQNYTGVTQCLLYFTSQNDKMVVNSDYPSIVTDGLVLNLDAGFVSSYPRSGTTWYDLSGNGNNGTLTNGPTFDSGNGGSIVFDGVDDYVGWNTLDAIKWQNWSSITVETVFRLVSYSGSTYGRQYLFDYRDNGGVNGAFACFYDNTGTVGFKLFYNTTGTSFEQPVITTFALGTLIYHQVTFDKTTSTNNIRHYINGNNVFTRSVTVNSTTTNSGRIWLGRFGGGGYQWNGNIFFYKIYNRALSAEEVLQNYNATKSRFNL